MLQTTKDILADLIAFPTISSDSNLEMIAYLATRLEDCGAEVQLFTDPSGTKANLFATLGPKKDGGIVLSGHCDVVPVADQNWESDPFTMVERDGRLYGRGSCDMKGFIASTIAMAPTFAKSVNDRALHFAFTYDEEVGCIGAAHLAQSFSDLGVRPSVAIIGEPTEMRIIEGHKGCYEYTTRFQGLEGHGSAPDLGVNAVEYAARYVTYLLDLKEQLRDMSPPESAFEPPWTTVNLGAIHGGSVHNVIAPKAQIDWEMRPVQQSDAVFIKSRLHAYCHDVLLPKMQVIYPEASIETQIVGEVEGLVPTLENEAKQIVSELTGTQDAHLVPFGTEGGLFQGLGMDVVICGPGSIEQAHKADEFVTVDQLERCTAMLSKLSQKLAS
ncbi:acetylornithine deacetylase [Octadecabacter temperatus]|uniref:Acetylornithine deacetylase n=1 Tax=Octadecabacter temperatus TaxID=1458307 RepID=A0A0K0Y5Z7_9RHOB|nr:acetylornithine deacetylase [Octadecabacter temperatus]AKS46257.1 Acetylornithine deacetylase [Octadecabacter temperatus]SIO10680.1 acetylornithine deacetylase [Octadecabacter temperatus]